MTNLTFKLIETADGMKQSIDNALNIVDEQTELCDIVHLHGNEKFASFVTGMTSQIEDTRSQISTLEKRKAHLDNVINACTDEATSNVVTELCLAFGIFGKEVENALDEENDKTDTEQNLRIVE